jgi:GxxExxY protein
MDIVVQGVIVLELKSVERIAPVRDTTLLTYLRLSGKTLGLLINFNVAILKDGLRRFVLQHPEEEEQNLRRVR